MNIAKHIRVVGEEGRHDPVLLVGIQLVTSHELRMSDYGSAIPSRILEVLHGSFDRHQVHINAAIAITVTDILDLVGKGQLCDPVDFRLGGERYATVVSVFGGLS